jgi:hypothetical protein
VNFDLIPVCSGIVRPLAVEAQLESRPNNPCNDGVRLIVGTDLNVNLVAGRERQIFEIKTDVVLRSLVIENLQIIVSAVHGLSKGLIVKVLIKFVILINDRVYSFWQNVSIDYSNVRG